MASTSWFSRDRTIAPLGFNRWLIPPAALAVHLSIGQVYAFSVFNLPLTQLIGVSESAPEDWSLTQVGWIYSIAIVFLGLSAAFGGRWLETAGPRKAMVLSACFFASGFLISAIGVQLHALWLIYFGYGVLGGIGVGLGYISPVSTLIKWFPDRPGLATGLAIMGFGGGAMFGAPLAVALMSVFAGPGSAGVAGAMLAMGGIYFCLMLFAAVIVRVPHADWTPVASKGAAKRTAPTFNVDVDTAMRTPQFWLLWGMLLLNVTAGIGVLGQASAMIQETFAGQITAVAAAGFVGLLSLFNMGGRFVWASLSDLLGRRRTFVVFFMIGAMLYVLIPFAGQMGSVVLFVLGYGLIISMYGGGFATIPAYLRDVFGTMHVGAIHGRLLTAWSVAGVLGPSLVNYLREAQIASGAAPGDAYTDTMRIMGGLLVIGFVFTLLLRPVDARHHYQNPTPALRSQPAE